MVVSLMCRKHKQAKQAKHIAKQAKQGSKANRPHVVDLSLAAVSLQPCRVDAPQLSARIQVYFHKEDVWLFGGVTKFDIITGEHTLSFEAVPEEGITEARDAHINLLEMSWRPAYARGANTKQHALALPLAPPLLPHAPLAFHIHPALVLPPHLVPR